ncbi:2-oxo acid dehydrogenase subunit E2 [Sessilibacter sp. MAH2]
MTASVNIEPEIIPLRGVRAMIANNMRKSLDEAAQLTHHAECDATALFDKKAKLAESGIKISVEDLIADVVINTLKQHPDLNGRVEPKEIHLYSNIHLSMAMALPGNLLVAPTIFNADKMDIETRANARKDLAQRAKINKLTVPEMTGGTFTISNLGLSRVSHFTPIINIPQIAILGVGQTKDKPWVMADKSIAIRKIMGLSLTFDHRAVDGAPAGAFLTDLCNAIEQS